jgi:DNA-binding transcriptional MerR regulator
VRYYQTRGTLTPPSRAGRQAVYGERQFEEILAIRTLQRAGVNLKEIKSQLAQAKPEQLEHLAMRRAGRADVIGDALDLSAVSSADRAHELIKVMKRLGHGNTKGRPLYLSWLRLSITKRCHLFVTPHELKGMTEERARDIAFAVYATLLDPEIARGAAAKGAADDS